MGGSFSQVTFKIKVTAAIERCKMQQSKKSNKCAVDRREIAQLLAQGKDETARFRAEMLLSQENLINAMELYALQAHVVLQRLRLLAEAKYCPDDLLEPCASMIYFGRNVSEIAEASNEIIEQFALKFGRDWVESHADNHSGVVSSRMVTLLSTKAPPIEVVLDVLREISVQFNVPWSPKIVSDGRSNDREDPQAIGQVAAIRPKVPPLPPQTGLEPPGRERFMENENPARRSLMVRAQDMDLGGPTETEMAKYPGVLNISVHRGRDLYNTSWSKAGVGQSGAQSVYVRISLFNGGAGAPPFGSNPPESLQQAVSSALARRPGGATAAVTDNNVYTTAVDELSGTVPVWNSPFYSFKINAPWTKVCFQVYARGTLKDKLIGSTIVNAHYLAYLMQREQVAASAPIDGADAASPLSPVNLRSWLLIGRGQAYSEPAGAIEVAADYQPLIPASDLGVVPDQAGVGSGADSSGVSHQPHSQAAQAPQQQQQVQQQPQQPSPRERLTPAAQPQQPPQHQQQPVARSEPSDAPPGYAESIGQVASAASSSEDSMTLIPDYAADMITPSSSTSGGVHVATSTISPWTPAAGATSSSTETKTAALPRDYYPKASTSTAFPGVPIKPAPSPRADLTDASSKPKAPREAPDVPDRKESKDDRATLPHRSGQGFTSTPLKSVESEKKTTIAPEPDQTSIEVQQPPPSVSSLPQVDVPTEESDDSLHSVLWAMDLPEPPKTDVINPHEKKEGKDDDTDEDTSQPGGDGGSSGNAGRREHVPIVVSLPSPSTKNAAEEIAAAVTPVAVKNEPESSGDLDSVLAARLAALSK